MDCVHSSLKDAAAAAMHGCRHPYPFVRAWAEFRGDPGAIEEEVRRARTEALPPLTVEVGGPFHGRQLTQITSERLQRALIDIVARYPRLPAADR